ncbi:MAG TPA: tripartite tricarboxylate transporter substrate binding protein [Burkholderiales bacterium]|nr:tripartite tricarboxylate transporter substrate binding protein [Burkholderiales bacterium]
MQALWTGLVLSLASTLAVAQSWPAKPLRMVVPLAPGSTADIVSRVVATELGKSLAQPVVVENKLGAGGSIAMADVARAAPDGYTISFASQGTLVFNQALYKAPGYDSLKDFTPLAFVGGVSNVMIVHPTNPAKSPLDVVKEAKAKPGTLTFSSGGSGTSHHLSGVLFAQMTKTDLVHVPYKQTPAGILAVMTGEVAMGFFNTPTVIGQIASGKLKPLGVTSLTRSKQLPDVPTLDEQGLKGYELNTWFGFVGPAGVSGPVVERLNREINGALARPEVLASLAKQGFDIPPPASPAGFAKIIADDMAKWVPLIKASGATAQ